MGVKKRNLLKTIIWAFLIFISYAASGQQHRIFTFQKGDEFEKQTHLNSTCSIQRGKQILNISSSSFLSKTYQVLAVSDSAYQFSVSIKKMADSIGFQQKRLFFNSEKKVDTTSQIQKVLKYMMNKPSLVLIDKHGIILSASGASLALASDTLLAFAGLPEQSFTKGGHFDLVADFSLIKANKGYSWTASSSANNQKMITYFTIDKITDAITIVKFKSSVKGQYMNSSSNGTYILDNKLGLIMQRLVESVSTGYQVKNGVLYATTRRISLAEECKKKEEGTLVQVR